MKTRLTEARGVRHVATILVLAVLATTGSAPSATASAQQTDPPPYGILVMAHGGNEEWNRIIADAVRTSATAVPARVALGMADRATLESSIFSLEELGVRRIAVVRLFVSGDSFLPQTEYLLGLEPKAPRFLFDSARTQAMRPVADPALVPPIEHRSEFAILDEGLVDAELSGSILAQRALQLSKDPEHEAIMVIAHGQGDDEANDRLVQALQERARTIREAAPFREVAVATLREDWPDKRAAAERRIRDFVRRESETSAVIVLPFRVSGFGPYAEVLEELDYVADGVGLLPHDDAGAWVFDRAHRMACASGWVACNAQAQISAR